MERQKRFAPSKTDVPAEVFDNMRKLYLESIRVELRRQFFDNLDVGAA